jgi:hypothetical protein
MTDVGDVAITGADTDGNLSRISDVVRRLAERGALVVAVGGDHSISFPVGRGMGRWVVRRRALRRAPRLRRQYWGRGSPGSSSVASRASVRQTISAIGLRNCGGFDDMRREACTLPPPAGTGGGRRVVQRGARVRPHHVSIDIDVLDLPLVPGGPSRARGLPLSRAARASQRPLGRADRQVRHRGLSPPYGRTRPPRASRRGSCRFSRRSWTLVVSRPATDVRNGAARRRTPCSGQRCTSSSSAASNR